MNEVGIHEARPSIDGQGWRIITASFYVSVFSFEGGLRDPGHQFFAV